MRRLWHGGDGDQHVAQEGEGGAAEPGRRPLCGLQGRGPDVGALPPAAPMIGAGVDSLKPRQSMLGMCIVENYTTCSLQECSSNAVIDIKPCIAPPRERLCTPHNCQQTGDDTQDGVSELHSCRSFRLIMRGRCRQWPAALMGSLTPSLPSTKSLSFCPS